MIFRIKKINVDGSLRFILQKRTLYIFWLEIYSNCYLSEESAEYDLKKYISTVNIKKECSATYYVGDSLQDLISGSSLEEVKKIKKLKAFL
jgi:hypothetical protein